MKHFIILKDPDGAFLPYSNKQLLFIIMRMMFKYPKFNNNCFFNQKNALKFWLVLFWKN